MALTVNSTVSDIVKKPGGKAIIDKYYGSVVDQSTLSMAMGMTVQMVAVWISTLFKWYENCYNQNKTEGVVAHHFSSYAIFSI